MNNKSTHTSGFFSLFAYLNIASRFKQHEAHLEAGQRPKTRRSEKNHVGNCTMKRVDQKGDDESKRRASEASSAQGLACRIERPSSSSSRARSNPKRRVRRAARSRPWRAAGKDQGGERRAAGQALVALLAWLPRTRGEARTRGKAHNKQKQPKRPRGHVEQHGRRRR